MENELCQKLVDTFPELFPKGSFWPECGDGWFEIIFSACQELQTHHAELTAQAREETGYEKEAVCIDQIKEKFGSLRISLSWYSDLSQAIVSRAEDQSHITCETCGQPGQIYPRGWITVACERHVSQVP